MSDGFYGNSLATVAGLMALLDNPFIIEELDDAGLAIEGIQITDAQKEHYVGNIEFDEDGHPVFYPGD